MKNEKLVWNAPELKTLDVSKTLTGPNFTPVETQDTDTGEPFGGPGHS